MALTLTSKGQGGMITLKGGSFGGRFTTSVTPPSLLLDVYSGATAAYSLRKLSTAYTGAAIRVRRSGDNNEMDIGFVNNVLDTTTLLTFVGSGNGNVVTWYDQSGNSNNAITVSGTTQPPIIVISGILQTQNSKPCIKFRGTSNSESLVISNPIQANTDLSVFLTAKSDNITSFGAIVGAVGAPTVLFGSSPGGGLNAGLNGSYGFVIPTTEYASSNYVIFNVVINSTNYYLYRNNDAFSFSKTNASLNPTSFGTIGRYANSYSNAIFSEIILYKIDQLSNRTGIVSNTNSFYSIF